MITRDQLLAQRTPKIEAVPAPELGDGATLGIRALSISEVNRLDKETKKNPEMGHVPMLTMCCCTDGGEPLFTAEDTAVIDALPISLVLRVIAAYRRINGGEDAEKN